MFALFVSLLSYGQVQIGSDIDGTAANVKSGSSVSLSDNGKIVAIGSPNYSNGTKTNSGLVRIYENVSGTWTKIGNDIVGNTAEGFFGHSVSLSSDGKFVAIGAYGVNARGGFTGVVSVYENITNNWTRMSSEIIGDNANNYFGFSVSLSDNGQIVAIGAPFTNYTYSIQGMVKVYEYRKKNTTSTNKTWNQIGSTIYGSEIYNYFGYNVCLSADGSLLAVGSTGGTSNVKLYKNVSGTWTLDSTIQEQKTGENLGHSVSLSADGNTVAIGAPYNDVNGYQSGQARVYQKISGIWTQIGSSISGNSGSQTGHSVALSADGTILAVGAPTHDQNFAADSGQVRMYKNIAGTWTQIGTNTNGEAGGDNSGHSVSLSADGNTVAIGAPYNDGSGSDAGHVRVYDLTTALDSDDFVLERFAVYPNPAVDFVTIQLQDNLTLERVAVYNSLGQLVMSDTQNTINISALAKGIYYFEVHTNQGKATRTVVK